MFFKKNSLIFSKKNHYLEFWNVSLPVDTAVFPIIPLSSISKLQYAHMFSEDLEISCIMLIFLKHTVRARLPNTNIISFKRGRRWLVRHQIPFLFFLGTQKTYAFPGLPKLVWPNNEIVVNGTWEGVT